MNKKQLKRALVLVAGVLSIILGLIGLVLPFLQGWLFLAIGIILLSIWSPRIREFMDKHTLRYPKLHKVIKNVEQWVVKRIGEV
jgi:uncharacterized protein